MQKYRQTNYIRRIYTLHRLNIWYLYAKYYKNNAQMDKIENLQNQILPSSSHGRRHTAWPSGTDQIPTSNTAHRGHQNIIVK